MPEVETEVSTCNLWEAFRTEGNSSRKRPCSSIPAGTRTNRRGEFLLQLQLQWSTGLLLWFGCGPSPAHRSEVASASVKGLEPYRFRFALRQDLTQSRRTWNSGFHWLLPPQCRGERGVWPPHALDSLYNLKRNSFYFASWFHGARSFRGGSTEPFTPWQLGSKGPQQVAVPRDTRPPSQHLPPLVSFTSLVFCLAAASRLTRSV